jgi:hypothetical protein
MSYKKILQIPRAERTFWSAERGGRTRQSIGGKWVSKYSYSPYTAKSGLNYTFYADIEMEKEIESPPESGTKRKFFTVPAFVGTFVEFRKDVLSGENMKRLEEIVVGVGGGNLVSVGYWRNKEGKEQ